MKAAILGTTGYTGMVLLRLLFRHPEITTILPVSSSRAGAAVLDMDPGLHPALAEKCGPSGGSLMSIEAAAAEKPDVVFAALPHLKSAEICAPFFGSSVVIDLSADFRIKDEAVFEQAYGTKPPRPDLVPRAVYGLCEIYRKNITTADLIANPGCYPTCTLLPLLPLVKNGIVGGKIIVNALSGISGAGKKAKEDLLFCERTENTNAYAPGKSHRHSMEIQQELDTAWNDGGGGPPDLFFTPHLVPLKRGMAVTTAVELAAGKNGGDAQSALENQYAGEPFVRLTEKRIPETADVWGSNRCDIGLHVEGNTLFLFSVIDNLVKGASGQAVQNMNIRFGFVETAGIALQGEL
jgi:N-acetyl-gamma-glutamyl-phosphate reductase